MATFNINTQQEREALMAAISAAIDFHDDTLMEDLYLSNDEASLNKDQLKEVRKDLNSKVDRLVVLVRLSERLAQMVV